MTSEQWSREKDGVTDTMFVEIEPTGLTVEPTGVVHVSIEAFREILTELGFERVDAEG